MVQVEQPPDRPFYGSESLGQRHIPNLLFAHSPIEGELGRHQRWKLDKRTATGWRRERNIPPIVYVAAERRNETIRSLGQRLWNVRKRHEQGTVALHLQFGRIGQLQRFRHDSP